MDLSDKVWDLLQSSSEGEGKGTQDKDSTRSDICW